MRQISSKSNIKEIASVGTEIINLNKQANITEDAYFTITYEKLSAKTDILIQKIRAGWAASDLQEKDELRDLDIRAIFYEVEAKCIRRNSPAQLSAEKVKAVLDRYGLNIISESYSKESVDVKALLSDLNADGLVADRSAIPDLDGLIRNLENSQAAFDLSFTQNLEDRVDHNNAKSASILAQELRRIINTEFCPYVGAMAQANADKFKVFADLFSELIERNNKEVSERIALQKRDLKESEA
ncbi:DUF6261 family protein [Ancylomarina longa]|uniref:Uncharacterized protein n=1 Tax=Ancylomarina longa TaxID=2487017 RepID=A0A434AGK9_9BACT|nr:DUF6261 family protein [Ancylomarina longa]RUT73520.1 hypothetical protein DLK05_13040 [Ancylomarina longa]